MDHLVFMKIDIGQFNPFSTFGILKDVNY